MVKNMMKRKKEIVAELGKVGLLLRSDSRMCAEYIDGSRDDLQEIVKVMIEMNFLHKYTDYADIMKRVVQRQYDEIADLGWLPTDEYEMLVEQIDFHALSQSAQRMALKAFKGNRDKVPDSLVEKFILKV